MKKTYVKPSIEMETFSPNEYIATCYAIVDINDATNFVVRANVANNGKGTDGQNGRDKENKYLWNNRGFSDDNIDILSHKWKEVYDGNGDTTFYNGGDMRLTSQVQAWEANHDANIGDNLVTYDATPVTIKTITADNASQYNTTANAS